VGDHWLPRAEKREGEGERRAAKALVIETSDEAGSKVKAIEQVETMTVETKDKAGL